jgi:hypothetical protein
MIYLIQNIIPVYILCFLFCMNECLTFNPMYNYNKKQDVKSGCFSGKNLVMMRDGNTKQVSEIEKDDEIMAYSGSYPYIDQYYQYYSVDTVIKFKCVDGKASFINYNKCIITPTHPILVNINVKNKNIFPPINSHTDNNKTETEDTGTVDTETDDDDNDNDDDTDNDTDNDDTDTCDENNTNPMNDDNQLILENQDPFSIILKPTSDIQSFVTDTVNPFVNKLKMDVDDEFDGFDKWCRPCDLSNDLFIEECEYVYNFILKQGHIININGINCVTLGHNFIDTECIVHDYFGTSKIINDIKKCDIYNYGHVVFDINPFLRDTGGTSWISGIDLNKHLCIK